MADALPTTSAVLETEYGSANLDDCRRIYHRNNVCSLTGDIVCPCITMSLQDRGAWNELISFED